MAILHKNRVPSIGAPVFEVHGGGGHVDRLAQVALDELENRDYRSAASLARQGLDIDPDNPWCRACLAVCAAADPSSGGDAKTMCQSVIDGNGNHPAGYFAQGHLHLLNGSRRQAYRAFARARAVDRRNRELQARLQRQDPRRPPVLSWLPRNHTANAILGRLRARLPF